MLPIAARAPAASTNAMQASTLGPIDPEGRSRLRTSPEESVSPQCDHDPHRVTPSLMSWFRSDLALPCSQRRPIEGPLEARAIGAQEPAAAAAGQFLEQRFDLEAVVLHRFHGVEAGP